MAIDAYEGIPQKEIDKQRTTSEGKQYSLNHPKELVVPMRYKGDKNPNANSQGWERSSSYYFKELKSKHPEYFGKKNTARISKGESPRIDAQYVKSFPQYKGYENEKMIHHHIGKDGQAVALPSSVHKGSGEIHTHENKLGVTRNAQQFSRECKKACERNPSNLGRTSSDLKKVVSAQQRKEDRQNEPTQKATRNTRETKNTPTQKR